MRGSKTLQENQLMTIVYWPCGTWCRVETLAEYTWMSDDFNTATMSTAFAYEDVDDEITKLVNGRQ